MGSLFARKKLWFVLLAVVLIGVNLYTLSIAYPQLTHTLNLYGKDMPRDFSVYYISAWRMFHNPSQIFTTGCLNDGEPMIQPNITPYKYLPSFLPLIAPLASLNYYQALWVFDAFQLALLPLIALLLYYLLKNKHPSIVFAVLLAVLFLPYPLPGKGLSVAYFSQWVEGQAKVLLTFLLLASYYLGYTKRPWLSGVVFAFGAFDPRFIVLGLPLFLFYNKSKLRVAVGCAAVALFGLNFMLFYPGVAQGFVSMIFGTGLNTPFYESALIPIVAIVCLVAVNAKDMIGEVKVFFSHKLSGETASKEIT
jgi:hypothetical protein